MHNSFIGYSISEKISPDYLSHILGALYDAALDEAGWVKCLEAIRVTFSGNYASLIVRKETADDVGLIVSAGDNQTSLDPGNPFIAMSPFAGLKPDTLVTIRDVTSEQEWRASAYYLDYCKHQGVFHVMAADIATRDGGLYGFRVTRAEVQPDFSRAELEFCGLLLPHIKRALNLHLSINQDRKVSTLYSHAMTQMLVGVVILDQNGLVIECNPAATAIFGLKDGLTVDAGQLQSSYSDDNRKLQKLLREALNATHMEQLGVTQAMTVTRPSGKLSWGLILQRISSDQCMRPPKSP